MQISDIQSVKVDWMEGYRNDPCLKFVLKNGRKRHLWNDFRFRQYGNLFFAELEDEVRFIAHDRNDHNGFGGSVYKMQMVDGYSPAESGFKGCYHHEFKYNSGGGSHVASCKYEPETNCVYITGPWSSGESTVSRLVRPCVNVAILDPQYNNKLRNPNYYRQMQKLGKAWDGTYCSSSVTLEFAQEAVDKLAPWLDLYQGDYGWYPKWRDMEPKNPAKGRDKRFASEMSDEQSMCVEL